MDSTVWKVQINTLFTVFFGLAPSNKEFKEILPPKKFFRQNLIFWIVMGCGKAHFGCKGQKTPKIENFGLKVCSLGPRGDPHIRPRGNPR